jgi:hypothetical protein
MVTSKMVSSSDLGRLLYYDLLMLTVTLRQFWLALLAKLRTATTFHHITLMPLV